MGTLSLSDYEDVIIPVPWGHISGRWYGNLNERPILAIHGWLDNLGTFDTLIPLLPDYLGVLCIDMPGHGRSSWLPAGMHYDVADYVLIIMRIMKEYKWTRVSLMAHSMGSVLSFVFTALKPHIVDMVISLDMAIPLFQRNSQVNYMAFSMDKHLIEDERVEQQGQHEPPSYTLTQLQGTITQGNSVPAEFAQHLLYRSVAKSRLYPEKFYFSRDGRVKFYNLFVMDAGLAREMALRIKHTPYIIIKASDSYFVNEDAHETISILGSQNKNFELYEVQGSHHAHLHNAAECANYIVPFIRRHRPPKLASWSLPMSAQSKKERRKAQERLFVRQKAQLGSKL